MNSTEKTLLVEAIWTVIYLIVNPTLPTMVQGSWTVVSMIIMLGLLATPNVNPSEDENR